MIISHKHRFIFLKCKKTAGTSVEVALSRYCGPEDVITPFSWPEDEALRRNMGIEPRNFKGLWAPLCDLFRTQYPWQRRVMRLRLRRRFYSHITGEDVRRRVGRRVWDEYFKFCFDRNPWDKNVSLYRWKKHQSASDCTFEQFLADGNFCRNFGIYSLDGHVAVDMLCRYERLVDDLRDACAKVGIDYDGWLPNAKGATRSAGEGYRQYYTRETQDLVARIHADEIAALGYAF